MCQVTTFISFLLITNYVVINALTLNTNSSPYNKGQSLKVCVDNVCKNVSPSTIGTYESYNYTSLSGSIEWDTDYIFIEGVDGEKIGITQICPFKIGPTSSTDESRALQVDGSPKKNWSLKYWGSTTFIATDLNIRIKIGNCDWCDGVGLKLTWQDVVCPNTFGVNFACSPGISKSATLSAQRGESMTQFLGMYGGLDATVIGFSTMIAGVTIENLGTGAIGIEEISIKPWLTGEHCYLRNNYGGVFSIPGGQKIFFVCTAPQFTISASIIPLPGVSTAMSIFSTAVSNIVSVLSSNPSNMMC